ncbi:MAG: hypothetical protein CM15mP23_04910 [Cryomorphaceae bacterium]|nr:MAG: hypothetical protein CM15mP23_04910 [Cryomorphaceae bacterium]
MLQTSVTLLPVDDGSCEYIYGCTDVIAENYNPSATNDDGSCEYVLGCTDASAITSILLQLKKMVHVSS